MTPPHASDLLIDRADGHRLRVDASEADEEGALAAGQALLSVDTFGLSANNVTYAVLGDALGYWRFFPAPDGWGRVPVWGFADVARSRHPDLAEGERVFGYLPMSSHLVVEPDRVLPADFRDATPHRRELPGVYNHYARTAGDGVRPRRRGRTDPAAPAVPHLVRARRLPGGRR